MTQKKKEFTLSRAEHEDAPTVAAPCRWKYIQNYADAKGTVVEEIITRGRVVGGD
jgi:hypothetical protein